jgi:hypothetical protein
LEIQDIRWTRPPTEAALLFWFCWHGVQGELLVEKVPNRFFEPINCWLVGNRVLNPLVKFLAFLTHGKVPHSRVEAPASVLIQIPQLGFHLLKAS